MAVLVVHELLIAVASLLACSVMNLVKGEREGRKNSNLVISVGNELIVK